MQKHQPPHQSESQPRRSVGCPIRIQRSPFFAVAFLLACHCGASPVSYGQTFPQSDAAPGSHRLATQACDSAFDHCGIPDGLDIERGHSRPFIDGLGWMVGIPKKLLYWDRRVENHDVSASTLSDVGMYLHHGGLTDTKVRVNQYDPVGEWDRLVENRRIAPGWKYTLGTLRQIRYIFVPGRIFGSDDYNPYTDTLSLYSDVPALGMAEAAYAKDVRHRNYPGTYAAIQSLPLVAMWHESLATDDVATYVAIHGDPQEQDEVRRVLYARYGISLGGQLGEVLPDGSSVFQVVGAVAGHATASIENRQLRR